MSEGLVKLKEIIAECSPLDIPTDQIRSDSRFLQDLGFDSMSMITFIVKLEQEFQVTFPYELLVGEKMATVQNLENTLSELIAL
ncbi:acyl carrier protein [Paenibacillus sp. FJAT-26967]|uniref:acyl carrier protein n=1 Tax=Paenibacillus sp. FJAT-26967 TaxID=1729690 RepID=UPI00083928A1|nr:acyl carrier protein [Paenibacillus sp. FJAT-26967]